MKWLFSLLLLMVSVPVLAEPTPVDEPLLQVYSTSKEENSRRAIRLGYQNFRHRLNTPDMTDHDTAIAQLVTSGFQPFFEKLNNLESLPQDQRNELTPALNEEFQNLVIQLAALLFKNQHRYTNPLFLSDEPALQETVAIVQEAVNRGSF